MFDTIASTGTLVNPAINSAFNQLLSDVLQLALLGLTTLAAIGIKKWKDSLNSGWKKALAERGVKYAEQRFLDNTAKRAEVAKLLSSKFPRISAEEIDHLLEEAVWNMKSELTASVAIAMEPPVTEVAVNTAPPEKLQ